MSLIFIGDIHQNWHHVAAGLSALPAPPRAAVLLGDIECMLPLDQLAAPLLDRGVEVYWIHGNHEHDAGREMWENLAAPERNPHAGDLALKGAKHEFSPLKEVKPGPIKVRQRLVEHCGHVRRVAHH